MKAKPFLRIAAALMTLLPATAWATSAPSPAPAPYVKPSSLWPFHAFEALLLVLGFFAAYRAIRSKLPPGDDVAPKKPQEEPKDRRKIQNPASVKDEIVDALIDFADGPPRGTPRNKLTPGGIAALRGIGLLFMLAGSALAFNSGGIYYGPVAFDEELVRIFGGVLFVIGVIDFAVIPRVLGTDRK